MIYSSEEHPLRIQARLLLADIEGAPDVALPRRLVFIAWLRDFLNRTSRKGGVPAEDDAGNLIALEQFLRECAVPVTTREVAA